MPKLLIGSDWTTDPIIDGDDLIGDWAAAQIGGNLTGRTFTVKADGVEHDPNEWASAIADAAVLEIVECTPATPTDPDLEATPEPESEPEA